MEDPTLFNQYQMELDYFACPPDDFDLQCFSTAPESDSSNSYQCFNYQTKPNCLPAEDSDQFVPSAKPSNKLSDMIMAPMPPSSSPPSQLISFEDRILTNYDNKASKLASVRSPAQAQEHIITERKRREKLSQNFIALSAILPGLRKMDRGSVLGDAVRYMKQLQEQVKALEEKQAAKKGIGSAVLVKKSVLLINDDCSDQNPGSYCYEPLPEIRVTVSGEDLLIKIHCEKHSECAAAILGELKKRDYLTVHSCIFFPFGNSITDGTIIAKMNKENCMTAKDLVRSLQQALKQFI